MTSGHPLRRALAVIIATIAAMASSSAADPPSHYVRQNSASDTAIVFIHGILGNGQSTWTKRERLLAFHVNYGPDLQRN
jgi:hypothetical protein